MAHGADEIHLLISSDGGFSTPGYGAFNALLGWPIPIFTHNVGSINSMANILFLSGSRRIASPASTFLLHGTTWTIPSAATLTREQVSEISNAIIADEDRMADVFVSRAGIEKSEIIKLIDSAATVDAAFALKHGIVHEVGDLAVPPGSIIRQV